MKVQLHNIIYLLVKILVKYLDRLLCKYKKTDQNKNKVQRLIYRQSSVKLPPIKNTSIK